MKGWNQAEIWTIYPKRRSDYAFSFLKNVLDRAKYDDFFYTASINRYGFWSIIVRFKNLKNKDKVEEYVNKVFKSEKFRFGFGSANWSNYGRDHLVPLLIEASKISLRRDTLLTSTALHYLMHCIAMTSFLTPGESARIWLDLLNGDTRKVFYAQLEKAEI